VKKWLKRNMPAPRRLLENRQLSVFGKCLHDPRLWYLNRRSVSGAVAVGFFMMFMPPFGQMVLAAAAAIVLRVNLPLAVVLVWITNPLTIPPMFYFAYLVGSWLLGVAPKGFDLGFWTDWHNWSAVMAPLGLGMLVCAVISSALGYCGAQALWRRRLVREIRRRKQRYRELAAALSESAVSTPSSSRQI